MTTTIERQWEATQLFGVAPYDGKSLRYRGDIWAPSVEVRDDYDAPIRQCEGPELIALRIQVLAERYLDREVLACQSSLVDEILKRGDFEFLTYEDIENVRENPANWTAAKCRQWLEDNGVHPDTWESIASNPFTLSEPELRELVQTTLPPGATKEEMAELVLSWIDDEVWGDVEDWRNAVRDNAPEREIYEWWLVSEWLHNQLKELGYAVLDDGQSHWWGRTTTGQGIIMDGVLQDVAAQHAER